MLRLVLSFVFAGVLVQLSGCLCTPEQAANCTYQGKEYSPGAAFEAEDGCNECVCNSSGSISCTRVSCDGDAGEEDASRPDVGGLDLISHDLEGQDLYRPDAGPADAAFDAGPDANQIVPIPPSACPIEAINGQPGSDLVPNDDVLLGLTGFPPPTPGATIESAVWSVVRAPAGSRTHVGPTAHFFPDLVGTYVLRVLLTDDQSASASHDCALTARPASSFYVELIWNRSEVDVDLQLIKQDDDDKYCASSNDIQPDHLAEDCGHNDSCCYYGNCKTSSGGGPDWDGDDVFSAGDPLLLMDDLYGFGPEAIAIEEATAGSYLVAVHYFSAHNTNYTIDATVRFYAYGQLRGQLTKAVEDNDWWESIIVHWPETDGADLCVELVEGGEQTCMAVPQCEPVGQCDQCQGDQNCGPNTYCESDISQCLPQVAFCHNDSSCGSDLACIPATDTCGEPECSETQSCSEARYVCAPGTRVCILGPPQCTETNEPNNTPEDASTLALGDHADLLCRGDVDYFVVAGQAQTRLVATVTFDHTADDNAVRLLDSSGAELESQILEWGERSATVATDVATAQNFYLVLYGNGDERDEHTYTINISEQEPLNCEAESGEPNESLGLASALPVGTHQRALCGYGDTDFFTLTASSGKRTMVVVDFADSEGNINLELWSAAGASLQESRGYGDSEFVIYNNDAADSDLVLEVYRSHYSSNLEKQEYSMTITTENLPTCTEGFEPDNTEALAHPIAAPGVLTGNICDQQDHDFYSVVLASTGQISATLTFLDREGDLDLALRQAGGIAIDLASGTGSEERVEGQMLPAGTYFVDVYAANGESPQVQPYSVEISYGLTPVDAGVDDSAVEDGALNDALAGDTAGSEDAGVEDVPVAEDAG